MNIPLGPLLGLERIFDASEKDRGVLGSSDSRMESAKRSENSLNSSQGKTKPGLATANELSECMKHRITESSSIRFFIFLVLFLFFIFSAQAQTREQIEAQYEKVGLGFEAMMLGHLYKQMRESNEIIKMGENNPFAPSNAEKIFRSMREQEIIESLAQTSPLGVKNIVIQRLKGRGGIDRGRVIEYKSDQSHRARRAEHGN